MKSEHSPGLDRFFNKRAKGNGTAARTERGDERKEGLVLLAIAFLFVANVVLYLCHHYGLTSLNDPPPRSAVTASVMAD